VRDSADRYHHQLSEKMVEVPMTSLTKEAVRFE
jgi:hypothetical protein